MPVNLTVKLKDLRKKKLMLATPMYGGQAAGMFTRSCMDLSAHCAKMGIDLKVYFLFNESLITRARNYCCDEFVRSDCTHMMFIDSDIGFNPQDVLYMMAQMDDDGPYDIMCGPYPKKCIAWEKVLMAVNKGKGDDDPEDLQQYVGDFVFNPKSTGNMIPLAEPVEVLEGGTGFMMIRKSALQKFAEAFPHMTYRPDHVRTAHFDGSREIMMYFQAEIDDGRKEQELRKTLVEARTMLDKGIGEGGDWTDLVRDVDKKLEAAQIATFKSDASKRYLSEDYWFCQKAQEIGLKVWLCPWIQLNHVGTYVFGGTLMALASIGAPATADPNQLAIRRAMKGRHGIPAPVIVPKGEFKSTGQPDGKMVALPTAVPGAKVIPGPRTGPKKR